MNSHIKKLFDYVRSKDAQDGIERGFIQFPDGTFKDITGKKDAIEFSKNDSNFIGMMHTHAYWEDASNTEGKYSNQSFSLADIRNFIAHVNKHLSKEINKNKKPDNSVDIDLSRYYTGIVSKHGVYILTFNRKIKNALEFIRLFGPINQEAAKGDNTFKDLIIEQRYWIETQINETGVYNIDKNQQELLAREEQYVLDYLYNQYPSLKGILGLMFFDLTKDQPEGYSIYVDKPRDPRSTDKKSSNQELFYNRHDCK